MITEDYVSFETAKLLKEKGFDEECRAFYVKSKECGIELFYAKEPYNYNNNVHPCTSAPTLQRAMKWLREVHNLAIELTWEHTWFASITKMTAAPESIVYEEGSRSYEEACEMAVKYCLENLI